MYVYSKTRNQKPAPKDSAASLSARVRKDIKRPYALTFIAGPTPHNDTSS